MSTSALIFMISVQVTVTVITVYFFRKVFKSGNAFEHNDDDQ